MAITRKEEDRLGTIGSSMMDHHHQKTRRTSLRSIYTIYYIAEFVRQAEDRLELKADLDLV